MPRSLQTHWRSLSSARCQRAAADEVGALTCVVLKLGGVGTSRSWSVVNIDQTLHTFRDITHRDITHAYLPAGEVATVGLAGAIKQLPTG